MSDVHAAASTGYARAATTYAAGRPDYPAALAQWLTGEMGLGPGRTALDLGAGTGKFTARLAATGARVIAVEPVAEMRAALFATLPDVEVLPGTATAIPLADASVDVVTCGQSFHWFATPQALAEIARVLRPGGWLGLVWNVRDERTEWVQALTDIMTPYEGDAPRFHTGAWRRLFPAPRFGELNERWFDHAHVGPFDAVVMDRVMSVSFIASLPEAEQAQVRAKIAALAPLHAALADPARVVFPYRTLAVCVARI
jgi:SAM-dependent methyltransferase